jgi:CubicO group peptidase (beta-lactamase class C family)
MLGLFTPKHQVFPMKSDTMIEVQGSVAPGFELVRETFASLWLESELGASICVYHQGRKVVDLWAGYKDAKREDPWLADTLVNVYSTTKGMAATAMAVLFDEGLIDYCAPVSLYWPEFGAAGKAQITVAELLSHKAGLSAVTQPLSVEDLYDWQKMTNLIAAQTPLWSPGRHSGYHPVTWGYLPGELIRRITGMTMGEYFNIKVATPLDADCFIGLPDSEHIRCATLNGPNRAMTPTQTNINNKGKTNLEVAAPRSPNNKANQKENQKQNSTELYRSSMLNPVIIPFKHACSPAWRRAEIAASNGHASARGLAKVYGALSMNGSLGGVNILSREAIDAATQSEVETTPDLVMNTVIRRSRGFILNTDGNFGPNKNAFGHNGAGGSTAFADRENGVSMSYVMNQMLSDSVNEPRANRLTKAVYQCT